jgi:hypothetical protein
VEIHENAVDELCLSIGANKAVYQQPIRLRTIGLREMLSENDIKVQERRQKAAAGFKLEVDPESTKSP